MFLFVDFSFFFFSNSFFLIMFVLTDLFSCAFGLKKFCLFSVFGAFFELFRVVGDEVN